MGVIFGAVLYFVGHAVVLALANPFSLLLIPPIAAGLEYYAQYYRTTIREVHRNYLVRMSTVYQDMVEAITGRVIVRAYAFEKQVVCRSIDSLDIFQQVSFIKTSIQAWLGFRMAVIGYSLSILTQLQPIFTFYGVLPHQSAALVGFSIAYSQQLVGIIQQMIGNFSDLEMQFISIERLREYASQQPQVEDQQEVLLIGSTLRMGSGEGLRLKNVEVRYREHLQPALTGVTLDFRPRQVAAIMGRTGAGKTSLLLSVLQLVPYTGSIQVDGKSLDELHPQDVRQNLVGVVPQNPMLFAGSLAWNLDPEGKRSNADLWEVLEAMGLDLAATCRTARAGLRTEVVASDSGGGPGRLALSQGHQQLLCAARMLLRQPRVVLLDEVTASLPAETADTTVATLFRLFKKRDATVLLVTHQEALLHRCERVVTISSGRVISDRSVASSI